MSDSWIQTHGGRQFWPLAPRADDIAIADIAHSLSLLCRFNGHCREFYSVAEHSLRVSRICAPEHALWGLLHDAAEAYFGDIPRPVKAQFPAVADMEERLLRAVAEHFALPWPPPAAVRAADEALLATEARDLMGTPPADWRLAAVPLPERIAPLAPAAAELAFLARFHELKGREPADPRP